MYYVNNPIVIDFADVGVPQLDDEVMMIVSLGMCYTISAFLYSWKLDNDNGFFSSSTATQSLTPKWDRYLIHRSHQPTLVTPTQHKRPQPPEENPPD